MIYASFGRRLIGAIVDFYILIIVFYFLGGYILSLSWLGETDMQAAPFILLNMIIFPLDALIKMIQHPGADVTIYYIFFAIFFIAEIAYYSLMEILPTNATIGHIFAKTSIRSTIGNSKNIPAIIVRNYLKTMSRYLFAIPFFTMLFTNKNQTIYDSLTKIVVVRNPE